ncbi:hypothetical protein [Comamonas serinivorans]|uniref:hypothetical protein n=1 Tax=Comamonas serinivorans TaxID=1082851 RepID=UPI0012FC75E8|nr:hypothetical protein [Comamonas serinivorans]
MAIERLDGIDHVIPGNDDSAKAVAGAIALIARAAGVWVGLSPSAIRPAAPGLLSITRA